MVEKPPIPNADVIASRELSVTDSVDKVVVQLGRPCKVSEGEAVCPLRITYRNKTSGVDVHGIDTFQALELALKILPTELRHASQLPVGNMYAFEQGDDMGFPEFYTDEYFRRYESGPGDK
jgi:hypothetical protein